MSKLLSVLIAGTFAAGIAVAQTPTTTGSGALSGSVSGSNSTSGSVSGSTNTNTNTATSSNANVNDNTNTNTNNVNVYGPGSNKLARQQQSTDQPSTGVSMMPGQGNNPGTTAGTGTQGQTAQNGSSSWCPPGLAKKDNGCMPPGLARHQDGTTQEMGNTGSQPATTDATQPDTTQSGTTAAPSGGNRMHGGQQR